MVHFQEFETKTGGRLDALDITEEVVEVVKESGIRTGNALVFSPHTTCAVLIARPGAGLMSAMERAMHTIAPNDGYYAHDDLQVRTQNLVDDEPANGPSHIVHAFLGKASESVPVSSGQVVLGDDQRVLFVELDSSRPRRYCIQVVGE
ncbi:MAG: YjbQ family protein [Actinobacteria bacterium]|nr:YjbQ family protein [Actinomycetota bacterium]